MTAILSTMLAIAITLGVGGEAEIWGVERAPEATFKQIEHVTAPIVTEGDCVVIQIDTDASGAITMRYANWIFLGDIEVGQIRASLVGPFLQVAFNEPQDRDAWNMDLRSIDVSGKTQVTICI